MYFLLVFTAVEFRRSDAWLEHHRDGRVTCEVPYALVQQALVQQYE